MNEHLKLPGAYWCIGSLKLIKKLDDSRKEEMIKFVQDCQHMDCGGFGGNLGHDPHITSTLYAILIMAMYDSLSDINTDKAANYIAGL